MEFCFVFHLLNGEIPFNLKKKKQKKKKRFYPNSIFSLGDEVFSLLPVTHFAFIFEMITTRNAANSNYLIFELLAKVSEKRGGVVSVQTKFIFKSFKNIFVLK